MKNTTFRSRGFFFRAAAFAAAALPFAAALAPSARAEVETVWTKGVTADNYFDTTKYWTNDTNFCWAAAATNIIAWWQAQVPVSVIPDGTPIGNMAIYDAFCASFNDVGRSAAVAWEWYFGGCNLPAVNYANDFQEGKSDSGRYWENYVNESVGFTSGDAQPSWIISDDARDTYDYRRATNLANALSDVLKRGYGVVLSLNNASSVGHSITLWGLEREGDIITKLYITDSDDYGTGLISCGVVYDEELMTEGDGKDGNEPVDWTKKTVYLNTADYSGSYYIKAWDALALPVPVPEPSAFALLAGLGALALAGTRRRRKKA